jgi:hypothetical protein
VTRRAPILLLAAALAALALAAFGCRTAPEGGGAAAAKDVTGGVFLELEVHRPGGSLARYRVEPSGLLSFAGGNDAVAGRYSWSGPLTEAEAARLRELLDVQGWCAGAKPAGGKPPDDERYEVRLRQAAGRRSLVLPLADPGAVAIHDLLESAARRRHEEFLRSLPRAGDAPR